MRIGRGAGAWLRRAVLAVVLIGAAVIPGRAASQQTQHCSGPRCRAAGSILWTANLPGSWLAETGDTGTVPSPDAGYAATGGGLAVFGAGLRVTAFQLSTGSRAWQTTITGLPSGSAIVGVRAFTGVVAVGLQPPPGSAPERDEVIMSAATGLVERSYPAAAYGGAIAADGTSVVVVGPAAVTAYANSTGRALWSRPVGPPGQTWRISGQYVYVAQPAGSAGVLLVRRISLSTGAEAVLRPPGHSGFPGTLSAVVDGVMLFSTPGEVAAYDGDTGGLLWPREKVVLELADPVDGTVYLASATALDGVGVASGTVLSHAGLSVAGSLYWVFGGVALGLDQNALGDAWGYSLDSRRVLWTSAGLPWPHFFVDLSGLGGSAGAGGQVVLLATCGRVGAKAAGGAPQCLRPQLAAVLV
ncbi:MAG: PQQ-binding-like beta-propeller repeat protein [Streptosporangiaceae bacterium]